MLVLDSGGVSRLAEESPRARARITTFRRASLWPALIPSVVLVECLTDHAGRDTNTYRFIKKCDVRELLPTSVARRAASLRTRARRGSAVDAAVVAFAEHGGTVLTSDPDDLRALAEHANGVHIEVV